MEFNQENFKAICLQNTTKLDTNKSLDALINGVVTEQYEYDSYLELIMVLNNENSSIEKDSSLYNVVFKFAEADVTQDIYLFLSKHANIFNIDKSLRFDNLVESIIGFTYDKATHNIVTVSVDFLRSLDKFQNPTLTNLSDMKYDLYKVNTKLYEIEDVEVETDMR